MDVLLSVAGVFGDCDAFDFVTFFDGIDHVLAFDDASENGVFAIQVGGGCVCDVEL